MPKTTFTRLKEDKKTRLTNAFLREFAIRSYDEASLTEVVKQLGIAKGSIYQYFEGKLDLFMYLVGVCTSVKLRYVGSLKREDYPDYWAYFRDLFEHGYRFDEENPLNSHFLHNLTQNLNSPSVKDLYDRMMTDTLKAFEQMVQKEVEWGLFRDDLPIKTMGFHLYKIGSGIQEQLEVFGLINPKESIRKNLPVYQGRKEQLMETVDHYIQLVRPAFDKQTTNK